MPNILAMDVQYAEQGHWGLAAGVLFTSWEAEKPAKKVTTPYAGVADYMPGQFYQRELPCLLELLGQMDLPDIIIVDGYVDVAPGHPGLGRHLYEALGSKVVVIGVAKTYFQDTAATPVLRGKSAKPLFVTAAGMDLDEACACIQRMHGPFRIPTLLKLVDQIARGR